jgi:hypothetical protein
MLIQLNVNGMTANGLDFKRFVYPRAREIKAETSCLHLLATTFVGLWRFSATQATSTTPPIETVLRFSQPYIHIQKPRLKGCTIGKEC